MGLQVSCFYSRSCKGPCLRLLLSLSLEDTEVTELKKGRGLKMGCLARWARRGARSAICGLDIGVFCEAGMGRVKLEVEIGMTSRISAGFHFSITWNFTQSSRCVIYSKYHSANPSVLLPLTSDDCHWLDAVTAVTALPTRHKQATCLADRPRLLVAGDPPSNCQIKFGPPS